MSTIYFVRHGQASFGSSDYDDLSTLGQEQATLAGEMFAARGVTPDVMVTGSLKRQQVTGSRIWERANWEAPVEVDEAWNEFDHDSIIAGYRPAYRNHAVLWADMARHRDKRRAFQDMFVQATKRWLSGEHDEDYPESFSQFTDRVALGFGRIATRLESGQTAVVVTSSGPMSWVMATLLTDLTREGLELPQTTTPTADQKAVWDNLTQVTVNTGVNAVLVGRKLTPLTVNDHSHVAHERRLTTFR